MYNYIHIWIRKHASSSQHTIRREPLSMLHVYCRTATHPSIYDRRRLPRRWSRWMAVFHNQGRRAAVDRVAEKQPVAGLSVLAVAVGDLSERV